MKISRFTLLFFAIAFIITSVWAENALDKKMQKSMYILKQSLNSNDFSILELYLAENYRVEGYDGDIAKMVIGQVIAAYPTKLKSIEIVSSEEKDSGIYVLATFHFEDSETYEDIEFDFLLDKEGKFIEINIFKALTTEIEEISEENMKIPVYMEIPFELNSGLIFVEAEIDGIEGRFIVDSGAQMVILNSAYFKPDEERELPDDAERINASQGVGGSVGDINIAKVAKFKWDEFEMVDFDAVIVDISHLETAAETKILGLIGQRELALFEFIIDYEKQKLLLFQLDSLGEKVTKVIMTKPSKTIPFELELHIPIIKGSIGKHELRFGIDTGAQGNLIKTEFKDMLTSNFNQTGMDTLMGAGKNIMEVPTGAIDTVDIGGLLYTDMMTIFSDISHLPIEMDGLLGYEFLRQRQTGFNYLKKVIYIWE